MASLTTLWWWYSSMSSYTPPPPPSFLRGLCPSFLILARHRSEPRSPVLRVGYYPSRTNREVPESPSTKNLPPLSPLRAFWGPPRNKPHSEKLCQQGRPS